MATTANDRTSDYVLAEYNTLRQEITSRSGHQHMLLNLAATGSVAAIGLAASRDAFDPRTFLAIPPFVLVLFVFYVDHWRAIMRIGIHLRDTLRPLALETGADERVLCWERVVETHRQNEGTLWRAVAAGVFPGIGVAVALCGLLSDLPSQWIWLAAAEGSISALTMVWWVVTGNTLIGGKI